jgi:hypothetical protein
MNLHDELEAFKGIATGQDTQTRLIVLTGEGGMGKTHLLDLYRRVAMANHLQFLDLPLGPQMSVEECIDQIISCFGGFKRFPSYDQYRSTVNKPNTRYDEEEWQCNLTRKFLIDLSKCANAKRLVVFFDQYEKADPSFKKWLIGAFMPHISEPMVVVVAGREDINPPPTLRGYRTFFLKGVAANWFHRYVEVCKVKLDPGLIEEFHKLLHGRPKEFVEYVKSQSAQVMVR